MRVEYRNLSRENKGSMDLWTHCLFFQEVFLVGVSEPPSSDSPAMVDESLGICNLMLKITGSHQEDKCLMLTAAHCFCVEKPNPGIKTTFDPKGKTLTFTFTSPGCRYCISEQCLDTHA